MIAGGIPDYALTNRWDRAEMDRAAATAKDGSKGIEAIRTAKTVDTGSGCQTGVSTDLARGSFLELVSLLSGRR